MTFCWDRHVFRDTVSCWESCGPQTWPLQGAASGVPWKPVWLSPGRATEVLQRCAHKTSCLLFLQARAFTSCCKSSVRSRSRAQTLQLLFVQLRALICLLRKENRLLIWTQRRCRVTETLPSKPSGLPQKTTSPDAPLHRRQWTTHLRIEHYFLLPVTFCRL